MNTQTITIIGLNKITASVGLALKKSSLDVKIIGHDKDTLLGKAVKELGAIDKTEWNLLTAATKADILILNVPVVELEMILQAIGSDLQEHTVVIDLSRAKQAGLTWAEQYLHHGHYVGAVPILAAHAMEDGRSSIENAHADLFHKSVFCLVPSPKADPDAVETAVNFGLLLGSIPYFLNPAEYDSLAFGIETMPGLLATAMFNAIHKATGWRDMLRIAGLPFAAATLPMQSWQDAVSLAAQDKNAALRWLDAVQEELAQMRRWIYEEDTELMHAYLETLGLEREKWVRQREKNDWNEIKAPEINPQGFAEQMLGGFIAGQNKKKDE